MRANTVLLVVLLAVALGGLAYVSLYKKPPPEAPKTETIIAEPTLESTRPLVVDHKAAFAIFTNGLFRDFSAVMYHNLSPEVFIETGSPNVVQVKKSNVTWNDFFSTLPFALNNECLVTGTGETYCDGEGGSLRFYLNGELAPDALDMRIRNGDRLLVSFGSESSEEISEQFERIPTGL
jgi:hypothetical protein